MLLDTHVLLWLDNADRRLGSETLDLIHSSQQGVFFSAVSIAELEIKQMLGRIDIGVDLAQRLRQAGLVELPFTAEQAHGIAGYSSLVRHDPFDRMLIAQAAAESMPFLTADRTLLSLGKNWILDARK